MYLDCFSQRTQCKLWSRGIVGWNYDFRATWHWRNLQKFQVNPKNNDFGVWKFFFSNRKHSRPSNPGWSRLVLEPPTGFFDSTVETPGRKTSMKIDEVFSDSSFWGLHKPKHGICQQQTIYHFASKIVRLMMIFLDVYIPGHHRKLTPNLVLKGLWHQHQKWRFRSDFQVGDQHLLTSALLVASFPRQRWDLIDMDCDGCEVTLLSELVPLALRVRRVHLSTHSREIHQLLLGSLKAASWHIDYDFAPRSAVTSMTSVGPFLTKDGRIVAASPFQWRHRFFYGKKSRWDWLGLVGWLGESWWISTKKIRVWTWKSFHIGTF